MLTEHDLFEKLKVTQPTGTAADGHGRTDPTGPGGLTDEPVRRNERQCVNASSSSPIRSRSSRTRTPSQKERHNHSPACPWV